MRRLAGAVDRPDIDRATGTPLAAQVDADDPTGRPVISCSGLGLASTDQLTDCRDGVLQHGTQRELDAEDLVGVAQERP